MPATEEELYAHILFEGCPQTGPCHLLPSDVPRRLGPTQVLDVLRRRADVPALRRLGEDGDGAVWRHESSVRGLHPA